MTDHADVVVIGGGIIGASCLYYLTQQRAGKLLLLEKDTIAAGATGRSAGIIRTHYTTVEDARLAIRSQEIFNNWDDLIGGDSGFRRVGYLMIVGPQYVDHLERNVQMLRSLGSKTDIVDVDAVLDIVPFLSTDGIGAAAYEPFGGCADPHRTTQTFIERARDGGAMVRQGVEVIGLDIVDGAVQGVRTKDGVIPTRTVLLAVGAWTPRFSQWVKDLPLRTKRILEGYLTRPPQWHGRHAVVMDQSVGCYFLPTGEDVTLVGISCNDWDVDPDSFLGSPTDDQLMTGIGRVIRRAPAMVDAEISGGYAGVDGFTPDRRMILDQIDGVEGLFIATGGSGMGFKLAPAIGQDMARFIMNPAERPKDIAPFHLARFALNQPIQGQYPYEAFGGPGGLEI